MQLPLRASQRHNIIILVHSDGNVKWAQVMQFGGCVTGTDLVSPRSRWGSHLGC
jgi:hypothetical protein